MGGGWVVLDVLGGWLRYSETMARLDAHCAQHGPSCKMDRALKKGPVGLVVAWLAHTCGTKVEHDTAKGHISSHAARAQRLGGRATFKSMAASRGGQYQAVLQQEARLVGDDEERHTIG